MDELLARARHALEKARTAGSYDEGAPSKQKYLPGNLRPAVATGPEILRFPMWCSVSHQAFVVVAERQGDTLRMLRNELPAGRSAGSGGGLPPMPALGTFKIVDGGWPGCPHCGAKNNAADRLWLFWACYGESCGAPIHCAGERNGISICACGKAAARFFTVAERFVVRHAAAPTPTATAPYAPAAMAPYVPETRIAPAPAAGRLTFRGK
jgi:hypothetical protein